MNTQDYFYRDKAGREIGPLSLDVLAKFRAAGVLDGETPVRAADSTQWKRCCDVIADTPAITPAGTSPAAPASAGSASARNTWVLLALVAVGVLAFIRFGMSGIPSASDGEQVVQSRIKEESEGRITLAKFQKTNGQESELLGVKVYSLEFVAEIIFTENCKWVAGMFGQQLSFRTSKPVAEPRSGFSWGKFLDDSQNPGMLVKGDQRVKLSGVIRFVKKEKGWAVDGIEITKADVGNNSPSTNESSSLSDQSQLRSPASKQSDEVNRIRCINNLKEIGLAFRIWEGDNNDKYPFNVRIASGGTMELCDRQTDGFDKNAVFHFQVMSNELSTTKVLVCPSDAKQPAIDFGHLQRENVSYQLRTGVNVTQSNPTEILAICPIHHNVLYTDASVVSSPMPRVAETETANPREVNSTSQAKDCINILHQLDAAANQFALENGKGMGSPINFPNDLKPYIRLTDDGKIPSCQAGGIYSIKRVGDTPTCSLGNTVTPNHVLP